MDDAEYDCDNGDDNDDDEWAVVDENDDGHDADADEDNDDGHSHDDGHNPDDGQHDDDKDNDDWLYLSRHCLAPSCVSAPGRRSCRHVDERSTSKT
jgi:hypothetical protein